MEFGEGWRDIVKENSLEGEGDDVQDGCGLGLVVDGGVFLHASSSSSFSCMFSMG